MAAGVEPDAGVAQLGLDSLAHFAGGGTFFFHLRGDRVGYHIDGCHPAQRGPVQRPVARAVQRQDK
jgi:hypothetical protein